MSAAGSATNSGIEYQQRVLALFLISLYSQFDISQLLNINDRLIIKSISCETSRTVDDLNIVCENNNILMLQIKRKFSLSEKNDSEFEKIIEQFFADYISSSQEEVRYLIITTSDTSKNIRYDLRKIFNSIRLNDTGFKENILNEREKKTFKILESVFDRLFNIRSLIDCNQKEVFTNFCKKIFVSIIDVEKDMTTEKIAIMLLHSCGFNMPELLWNYLISQSLYFSSNRMSVNFDGVNSVLKKFLLNEKCKNDVEIQLNELLKPIILNEHELSAGKDVFLIESFFENFDFAIIELQRFDFEGKRLINFEGDFLLLPHEGVRAKVIRRFSTRIGLHRYIEDNKKYFNDRKVFLIKTEYTEDVENISASIKHRNYCLELLAKNKALGNCLHSGKNCFSGTCYMIEVDYPNHPHAIGLVREEYLKPLDRILGKAIIQENNNYIPSEINSIEWIGLLYRGQGMIKSIPKFRRAINNKFLMVGWNESNQLYVEYNYCIRNNLKDGSSTYAYSRGKIQRFPRYEADSNAKNINTIISKYKKNRDPWCISSKNWTTGKYSQLIKIKEDDEEIIEIESVEVCRYSNLLGELYNRYDNYYAPLCIMLDKHTEQILIIGNIVPLISNPFNIKKIIASWEKVNLFTGEYSLCVIHNDYEFDKHIRSIMSDNFTPVIDPAFTIDGKLDNGIVINDLNKIIEDKALTID